MTAMHIIYTTTNTHVTYEKTCVIVNCSIYIGLSNYYVLLFYYSKEMVFFVGMHDYIMFKREYTLFSSNLRSKFSQCYYIVTRECHISPESLCRELSKFTHYFDLVAMATLLAL